MIWLNFLSHQQNGCFPVCSTEMSVIIFKIIPKLMYINRHIILLLNYISSPIRTSLMVQLLRLHDSLQEQRFHPRLGNYDSACHTGWPKKIFLIEKIKFKEINSISWILTDGIKHFSRSTIYNFYWQHVNHVLCLFIIWNLTLMY